MNEQTTTIIVDQKTKDAYSKAIARATEDKLVAYRNDDGSFTVTGPSKHTYVVRVKGPSWFDLSCTCMGQGHVSCKHRAVVVWCRKYHVWAQRPSTDNGSSPTVDDQPPMTVDVPPSTEDEVRESEAIKASIIQGLGDGTWTLIAGVAPSFAGIY